MDRGLVSIILIVGLGAGGTAHADEAARRQASTLDETGKAAYRDGRYDDAIIAFKAAFKRDPDPKYLYNLGMAYRKDGQDPEAIAAFERYLSESPDAADADKVHAAMAFLRTRLEETRVELKVRSEPDGAALVVEGDADLSRGTTPYTGWHLPGAYDLRLEAPDRKPDQRRIVLALGKPVDLAIRLARPEAEPAGAAAPSATSPPPAAPAPERAGPSVWPSAAWTTAGLALLGAGLFGVIAHGKADQLDAYATERQSPGRTREGARQLEESVQLFGAAATGSLVLAGLAAATGVVLTW